MPWSRRFCHISRAWAEHPTVPGTLAPLGIPPRTHQGFDEGPASAGRGQPRVSLGREAPWRGVQCFSETLGGKQETAEKGWLGGIPTCCWGKEASRLGLTLRQR